jgi:hypothetical protein
LNPRESSNKYDAHLFYTEHFINKVADMANISLKRSNLNKSILGTRINILKKSGELSAFMKIYDRGK